MRAFGYCRASVMPAPGRNRLIETGLSALVLALILILGPAAPVAAGPLEDGVSAYERGDYATALRLLRPLADQRLAPAQFYLGLMYMNGVGVAQDHGEAAKWIRKAADQGLALAQFILGVMYDNGQGVAQDYVQAHMWFDLAASRFVGDAVKDRDRAAATMTPAQVAEAQRLAREWQPK